nr:MAG TPA: hypothetical protein [Bacteriophage sp.]
MWLPSLSTRFSISQKSGSKEAIFRDKVASFYLRENFL